jgi:hypothetical protein
MAEWPLSLQRIRFSRARKDRETKLEVPTLSDDQWQRIECLLGTSDPKWRAKIDEVLALRVGFSLSQRYRAARERDVPRIKRAYKLAKKLALLLEDIEAQNLDEVSDAAELRVKLSVRLAEILYESKRPHARFSDRNLCVGMLIALWNEARSGLLPVPRPKVGDESGPLVRFLIEAYGPIETLTPQAAREIARFPSRPAGKRQACEAEKLLMCEQRKIEELKELQESALEELRGIAELRRVAQP